MLRQIQHGFVLVSANHDHVGILAEHTSKVRTALACAEAHVVLEKQTRATELNHARLKADAGPQRRFFEDQGHDAAGEQRLAQAAHVLALEVLGNREDTLNLGRFQISHRQQTAHETNSGQRQKENCGGDQNTCFFSAAAKMSQPSCN